MSAKRRHAIYADRYVGLKNKNEHKSNRRAVS